MSLCLQPGCITPQKVRIANESPIKKIPKIGCIEQALYKFKRVGFRKFTGQCITQLHITADGLTRCIPEYRYDYLIPSPSRAEGFFALIIIELKGRENLYDNSFNSNDSLTSSEKKIIVETLAEVDAHLNKECGMNLSTKLSKTGNKKLSN